MSLKVKGQLKEAQLENLVADPANLPDGRVWVDTAASKAKVVIASAAKVLVTESGTATLTNKTLNSPVINTPTGIVKGDVGLGNVDNTSDATKNAAVATLTNKTLTTPAISSPTGLVKADVGLGNVDNTSDVNKPVSTAQATADNLNLKIASNLSDLASAATARTNLSLGNVDNTSDATKNAAAVVLTNKDFSGGTASNTSRLTIPKAAKTTLDGLTRKQGTLLFDTTSNKPYYDDGSNLQLVGSGSGGAKNYITSGDAEAGTTGFATYADAAGTRPVDGTGGTPSGSVTWTTSSSSPLSGTNSFVLDKGVGNLQGEGVGYAFTIDAQDKAKVLQISFNYLVNSGTFVAGTSTTDSDIIVDVYDVTSGVIIEPSSIKLLSNSTTISDKFNATFQTASNSTSYRLIFHVSSTSASPYALKIDSIAVSPSTYVYGTPITDWVSWTPTGSWSTNTTYTGLKRRVGDTYEYQVMISLAGAPTAATLTVNIPDTMDTAKLINSVGTIPRLGRADVRDTGVALYEANIHYNSTTSVLVATAGVSGALVTENTVVNATSPITFGSTDQIILNFSAPIVGLSSSVQMSDTTDTRVVSLNVNGAAPSSSLTGSSTDVVFNSSTVVESHGSFTKSTGVYLIPVSGYYDLSAAVRTGGTIALNNLAVLNFVVNGATVATDIAQAGGAQTELTPRLSIKGILLKSGDSVKLQASSSATSPTYVATTASSFFTLSRQSGPSAIAASESVNAVYNTAAAQSLTNNTSTIIDFGTKEFDSHGAATTGASWKFTAPTSGVYDVSAMVLLNTGGGWAAAENVELYIYKNGSQHAALDSNYQQAAHTTYVGAKGNRTIKLVVGDYIDIRFIQVSGGTIALVASASYNWVSIKRVGN